MSWAFGAWFVAATVGWSIFALQDAALTGLRSALWVPLENGLYGLLKIVLLVLFAVGAVGNGVFVSWTLPVLILLVPVTWLIVGAILPRHARESGQDEQVPQRRTVARYMAGDYTGQLLTQASTSLLPVLVVALLGVREAAYILPAQTIFTALTLLALGITSSLVVEGARDEARAHTYAVAVLRRIAVTVVPAAAAVAVAAPWLLELFGPQYRAGATGVLQLLMVSMLPRLVTVLYGTRCRLQNRTGRIAVLQAVQAAILLAGTVAMAPILGLTAVGWAALLSQAVPAVVLAPTVARWLFPRPTPPTGGPPTVDPGDVAPRASSSPR
jgi:O-antigen/teichoic acid export membrane protein